MRTLLFVVAALLASASPVCAATTWSDEAAEWATKLADNASKVVDKMAAPSTLTVAINKAYKLAKEQETITDKTWVDEKDLYRVADDTQALKSVEVEVPPSMNSKDAYERITDGVRDPGTLSAGFEELKRLDAAADQRRAEISRMKDAREKASELADNYQAVADTADKLARNSEHLVGDPVVEIASRLGGGSFSLSWLSLEAELVPALQERAAAATDLLKRYDMAISASVKDLAVFMENKSVISKLWTGDGISASSLQTPGSLQTAEIARIGETMRAQDRATLAAAQELRDFAAGVRSHNAQIAKFQQFLGMARAGTDVAQAANGGSSSASAPESPANSDTKPKQASAPDTSTPVIRTPSTPRTPPAQPAAPGPEIPRL